MRPGLAVALVLGLGGSFACGAVGTEVPGEPATPPAEAAPRPRPEPAAIVEPAIEPEPETEPVPEPEPEPPPPPPWSEQDEPRILAVQAIVVEAAHTHGVDPHLVNGVIWVESKFRPKARNRSGARGLMQLMPTTAKAIARQLKRPARIYDPEFNIHAGTWYIARMLAKFDGDESLALAAYVRGPSKIRAWVQEQHPFPSSVLGFVDKVQRARASFAARGWPPAPAGGDLAADETAGASIDAP
ncbi:MAG: lytic transglycosylase domain-containing protein, partial [Nannocystaceae bacterium]